MRDYAEKKYKTIPTWEELCDWFGSDEVQSAVDRVVAYRVRYLRDIEEIYSLDEITVLCHKCGGTDMIQRHLFGLAEITSEKRTWLETAVSVAVSAISLPTIGYGTFAFPGKTQTAKILRLHLVLCADCTPQSKSLMGFGAIRIQLNDAVFHPAWQKAQELGFTKFLSKEELSGFNPIKVT